MSNILEYKGYQAAIEFSAEDMSLFGRVLNANGDKIIFEIENPYKAQDVFIETIDDYLNMCKNSSKILKTN